MKNCMAFLFLLSTAAVCIMAPGCKCYDASPADLFSLHCAACHPSGGNTINPMRTLHTKDLNANNIRTPEDIVEKIRNPGTGMPRFSNAVITRKDALRIGEYILATYH